jgi:tartrate dehydrogenase/decarboxylase/D-malate dehydrogenase
VTRIAVIPGDGAGPEVTAESEKVLTRLAELDPALCFTFEHFPWGTDHYLRTGEMMPADALETLRDFDAIVFGAVGSPRVKDHITLRQLLLTIRFAFDHYVNLRPVRLLPGVRGPLAGIGPKDVDMLFVREGTEGEYAGLGDHLFPGTDREVALQTAVFSRRGTERVVRWAFERARQEGRSVTSISKANALQYSGVLWDDVFDEVAQDYSDVETHRLLVDAAAMFMVREPQRFEVVVASNLYADILTDLGAALMGGMGLAPSANLNPERRFPSMFEPIHGSAPDIAGRGIVDPLGSIWSVQMMLEHLGNAQAAGALMRAIEAVVAREIQTPDLGGSATTSQVGDAVDEALAEVWEPTS